MKPILPILALAMLVGCKQSEPEVAVAVTNPPQPVAVQPTEPRPTGLPPGWCIVKSTHGSYAPMTPRGYVLDVASWGSIASKEVAIEKAWQAFRMLNEPAPVNTNIWIMDCVE
jgi:hypothetical protein